MIPLEPGEAQQLGRYRPLASLGAGGMGSVLLTVGPDGRFAAVKQVHPSFASDPGFRRRFRQEVDASRKVSGAYTAPILDADPDTDTPWLATLYIAGPTLTDTINDTGPLPPPSLHHLTTALATALTDIHRAGLIHRDLKPSNILLTHDGPRVIDFGIARATEGSDLTASGHLIGSPAFMSPEQASSERLTSASDVFSLGSLLVFAATGRGPFTGESTWNTLHDIVHRQPDLSGVPSPLRDLAAACLAKDPTARPRPQQIVDLAGPVDATSPPWPPAVHDQITRQEAEARALRPPAGQDQPAASPETPDTSDTLGTSDTAETRNFPKRSRQRWPRIVAALGIAIALVAGATVTAHLLDRDEPPRAAPKATPWLPLDEALSLARLRRADPCRLLSEKDLPELRELERTIQVSFSLCGYRTDDHQDITLDLDAQLVPAGAERSDVDIGGQPVLLLDAEDRCRAVLKVPGNPARAIAVEAHLTERADPCAATTGALQGVVTTLRTDPPEWPAANDSVLPVAPCSLLDGDLARQILDTGRETPRETLHSCTWESVAAGDLRISVALGSAEQPRDADLRPVQLPGVTGYVEQAGLNCSVRWPHRHFEEGRTEEIEILLRALPGSSLSARPCEHAELIAQAVLANLPGS